MNTLYLVATPIGNLEDITLRAIRTLKEVSLIAAEDTRHTRKLLSRYEIGTKITSYHDHSAESVLPSLLEALQNGDIALVSDAGTPGINDPGYELVQAALKYGHLVSPIPGPSAPIAALSVSGMAIDTFLYLGYLPRKRSARRAILSENAGQKHTLVFLETPHRLLDALEDIRATLGNRESTIARELTKIHEEIFRGTVEAAAAHYKNQKPRGEITLLIAGIKSTEKWSEQDLREAIRKHHLKEASASKMARSLASDSGWSRRIIYRLILEQQKIQTSDEA